MKYDSCKIAIGFFFASVAWVTALQADEEAQLIDVVERGLQKDFFYYDIPVGDIEIMSPMSSQFESPDRDGKRFQHNYMKRLERGAEWGFITYKEHSQSASESLGRRGAKTITVTPTENALEARVENESNEGWITIDLASVEVTKIVSNKDYSHASLPQSEEFKLVVGSFKRTPTSAGKEMGWEIEEFKFRALVKVNQFTNEYHYQMTDIGRITESGWLTNRIP